jgi:probable rRNA maturation factor
MTAPTAAFALDVMVEDDGWSALGDVEAVISRAATALAQELGATLQGVHAATVCLDTDAEVRALNKAFRRQDKPTNVLSFPAPRYAARPGQPRLLGDIILARETVVAEATAAAIAPLDHLAHLAIHGLLHLLGHDHQDDAEATAMEAIETAALARLGIADPYADRP